MKLRRRPPSDAELLSWLETGRPSSIDSLLDDADVTARLERLTALPTEHAALIEAAFAPDEESLLRIQTSVADRVTDLERAATLIGLLELGIATARAISGHGEPPNARYPS